MKVIESHGYIAHVVDRAKEAQAKRRNPERKARRWVVEVCDSGFNRFRKLLVLYAVSYTHLTLPTICSV